MLIKTLSIFIFVLSLVGCQSDVTVETLSSLGLTKNEAPQVSLTSPVLSISGLTLTEGATDSTYQITFTLDKVSTKDTIVELSSSDISTSNTSDYILSDSSVTILAGNLSASVDIIVVANTTGEVDEELSISISTDSGVTLPAASVNVTIIDDDPFVVTVDSLFPINGINWGDYIYQVASTSLATTVDTSCGIMSICSNGGEHRKVSVPGRTSCDGLTASDTLDVFDWRCSESTNPVFFYSLSMKKGKGLANLIETDGSNFKSNDITIIKDGVQTVATSNSTIWWANNLSIVTLNGGVGDPVLTLNTPNTINVQTVSGSSRGITLDGDNISYIMLPGVSLSSAGAGGNDCDGSAGGNQLCLMTTGSNQTGAHIEGDFIGNAGQQAVLRMCNFSFGMGISLKNVHLRNISIDANSATSALAVERDVRATRARNIKVENFTSIGLWLNGDRFDLDGLVSSGGAYGIYKGNLSWLGTYKNLNIHGTTDTAIDLGGWYNSFTNIKISNTPKGIVNTGNGNVINKALITNSDTSSYSEVTSFQNRGGVLIGVTIAQGDGIGFEVVSSPNGAAMGFTNYPTVLNSIITENSKGILANDTAVFEDIIVTNSTVGIEIAGAADDLNFTGELVLGTNGTDCLLTSAGANLGLVNNGNCENQGTSDAVFTYGESLVNYFVGKVTDTENVHGSVTAVGAITDWSQFENDNRIWTTDTVASLLDSGQRGSCVTDGTCMIFDWTLTGLAAKASDANATFNEGDICPAKVQGDNNIMAIFDSYLKYSYEILDDDLGNDDGLCQSNEACIYMKNRGFDQGSGTLKSCVFQDGVNVNAITGVKMYSY